MSQKKITVSTKNLFKPAPSGFKKIKTAVSLTVNTAILVLLGIGYTEESLVMLLVKVGSSYLMQMLDLFLGENSVEQPIIIQQATTDNSDDTIFPTKEEPKGPQ